MKFHLVASAMRAPNGRPVAYRHGEIIMSSPKLTRIMRRSSGSKVYKYGRLNDVWHDQEPTQGKKTVVVDGGMDVYLTWHEAFAQNKGFFDPRAGYRITFFSPKEIETPDSDSIDALVDLHANWAKRNTDDHDSPSEHGESYRIALQRRILSIWEYAQDAHQGLSFPVEAEHSMTTTTSVKIPNYGVK